MAIYFIYQAIKRKNLREYLLALMIIFMAFFATFMSHERSTFIWQHLSIIQKIQFPWRFLNHSAFLFSLSLAFLPSFFKKKSIVRCHYLHLYWFCYSITKDKNYKELSVLQPTYYLFKTIQCCFNVFNNFECYSIWFR